MSKARENASDHVLIGVTFASYWLRGWYEFTVPIIERSKEIPVQSWILSKAIKNISNIQSLFFFHGPRQVGRHVNLTERSQHQPIFSRKKV